MGLGVAVGFGAGAADGAGSGFCVKSGHVSLFPQAANINNSANTRNRQHDFFAFSCYFLPMWLLSTVYDIIDEIQVICWRRSFMSCLEFCTCTYYECPFHPRKHNGECAPCIRKNLENCEIPACFSNKAGEGCLGEGDYSFYSFAEKVFSAKASRESADKR